MTDSNTALCDKRTSAKNIARICQPPVSCKCMENLFQLNQFETTWHCKFSAKRFNLLKTYVNSKSNRTLWNSKHSASWTRTSVRMRLGSRFACVFRLQTENALHALSCLPACTCIGEHVAEYCNALLPSGRQLEKSTSFS